MSGPKEEKDQAAVVTSRTERLIHESRIASDSNAVPGYPTFLRGLVKAASLSVQIESMVRESLCAQTGHIKPSTGCALAKEPAFVTERASREAYARSVAAVLVRGARRREQQRLLGAAER